MENNNLFREKSLKRISSPEALNDYIKVASPGVWMLIIAIILLMTGAFVYSFFFTLDETIDTYAYTKDGTTTVFVAENEISVLKESMSVVIDGVSYPIASIDDTPVCLDESVDKYLKHKLSLNDGDWVFRVYIDTKDASIPDGIKASSIVLKSFTPSKMIFN